MQAHVMMYSQPEQLEKAMTLEGMRHGDEAMVTIPNVRVDPAPGHFSKNGHLFFCGISSLQDVVRLADGDGKPLPTQVELVGDFHVPAPGYYDLRNVKLSSNGSLQVIRTPQTHFVPVDEDAMV
ncbi:MAG: hypothetical protein V1885_01850 [Candidatus Brennerbacteria bacterium]